MRLLLVVLALAAVYVAGARTGPSVALWLSRHGDPPGKRPYTQREVEAADCFRCGCPAGFQWQVCADGNIYRPLCAACDVQLNRQTLHWMGHPEADELMALYVTREA